MKQAKVRRASLQAIARVLLGAGRQRGTPLIAFVCFILGIIPTSASSEDARFNEEMSFQVAHNGGNCVGCIWIAGTGAIVPNTPAKFERFIAENSPEGIEIVLHSPGGNLIAGIELGKLIRKRGLATRVGRTAWKRSGGFSEDDIAPGQCDSACAYAFFGGVERSFGHPWSGEAGEPKIGFHQFRDHASQVRGLSAEQRAALDDNVMSVAQILSGIIVSYAMEMGVDPRIFSEASSIEPSEVLYPNLDQLIEMNVITSGGYSHWTAKPYRDGLIVVAEESNKLTLPLEGIFYCIAPGQSGFLRITSRIPGVPESEKAVRKTFPNQESSSVEFEIDNRKVRIPQERVHKSRAGDRLHWDVQLPDVMKKEVGAARTLRVTVETSRAEGYHWLESELSEDDRKLIRLAFRNCV